MVEHDNLESGQFGLVLLMGLRPMMRLGQMEASFFSCSYTWILLTVSCTVQTSSLGLGWPVPVSSNAQIRLKGKQVWLNESSSQSV